MITDTQIATTTHPDVVIINRFTPKPGMADLLIAAHASGIGAIGPVAGLLGGRLFRAEDGDHVILVSRFDGVASYERWMRSPEFAAHRARLSAFLDDADPALYEPAWEMGAV